ncbi:hypothetical protein SAMN05443575_3966 [Jatrophihabitans endophyticus]|uniref:Peptidase inhibitor family I36 n=1 Tax=Jatrophihabitans endophyticus TaxID=1206085 RepID=A0A1M5TC25_9ACTN|nr:hypothetical protein [Jatrophihabitans endophyticus]SHH48269.1 hypothetical protein SAMN05443575_3966 [Jatrophihabitans endophyticus]
MNRLNTAAAAAGAAALCLLGSSVAEATPRPMDPSPSFCNQTVGSDTRSWSSKTCNPAGDDVIGFYWNSSSGVNVSVWQGASGSTTGIKYFGSGSAAGGPVCLHVNGNQFWVQLSSKTGITKSVKAGDYFTAKHSC